MPNGAIQDLAGLLAELKDAVVLTGAGISTESGIPDFRSPGTGLWTRVDPMEYLSRDALHERPETFWRYFTAVFGPALHAQPNPGHLALARLEAAGFIKAVVTQNIDGLHQKAGSQNVLEVHGHLRTVHCQKCRRSFAMQEALEQLDSEPIPRCRECGGRLRPDVVLFGDPMPPDFARAEEIVDTAGLVIVVGSSLTVAPACYLAFRALRLAIINQEPTSGDLQADVIVRGRAGEVLTMVCKELGVV